MKAFGVVEIIGLPRRVELPLLGQIEVIGRGILHHLARHGSPDEALEEVVGVAIHLRSAVCRAPLMGQCVHHHRGEHRG